LPACQARWAIGHNRYSTTGDSALLNAQPIRVDCNKGMIALAHNGNLVNANEIRQRLERAGSIFQTTSDTEVVVHLIAPIEGADSTGRHRRRAAPHRGRILAGDDDA